MGEVVLGKDEGKTLLGRPKMDERLGFIFTFILRNRRVMLMENVSQIKKE